MKIEGDAIRNKLRDLSRRLCAPTELIINRWALERFLARLAKTEHRHRFLLRGALLNRIWTGDLIRATSGIDLMALDLAVRPDITPIVKDILTPYHSAVDGVSLHLVQDTPTELVGMTIPGHRFILEAWIGSARQRIRLNVGYGLPVSPGPEWRWSQSLLEGYAPVPVMCCPMATVIAEKLAAIVEYGPDVTRLGDYYDLWFTTGRHWLEGHHLVDALTLTFSHRDAERFLARRDGYWEAAFASSFVSPERRRGWRNWLRERNPVIAPPDLDEVVAIVAGFAVPLLTAVRDAGRSPGRWHPEGGWVSSKTALSDDAKRQLAMRI